jgi:glucoamylase
MESLEQWLDREYRYAATAMLRSVSPVDIVKRRPGFGQTMRPRRGAIVGSPVLADWKPDPDYFFHWFRDSSIVIDAVRLLHEDRTLGREALEHFADFVRFSTSLQKLDGRTLAASPAWRANVAGDFVRFLRDDAELAQVHGEAVAAEARVNPDGTLDISKWTRPQFDGPPLRALAVLRWARSARLDPELEAAAAALARADLDFTCRRGREPSFDIWEEEHGLHYYTLRVSAAALDEGATWLDSLGEHEAAQSYRGESEAILHVLDGYWLADEKHFRSRVLSSGARSTKELDIAVILAAIHADRGARGQSKVHSATDPRMHATLARLEALFDAAYPINRDRYARNGPALGRYGGDVYFSGGPWYVSTLGAAEFCFRAALGSASAEDGRSWIERGDAYLATVRAYTPESGELSEQFDPRTGAQVSSRHMGWSYAAFISCVEARRSVVGIS